MSLPHSQPILSMHRAPASRRHTIFASMQGEVLWIGVRPERRAPLLTPEEIRADTESGLSGDHANREKRQVTVIFREALDKAGSILGRHIPPETTRRNILIRGIPSHLAAGQRLKLGEAVLEVTGPCLPCGRMDETLGEGGRLALAQAEAGGLTTRVVKSGIIALHDVVTLLHPEAGDDDRSA